VIRRRVVIRGRVQGVFFRDSTQRQARMEGVSGWVENRPDGAVEAVFEGEEEAVRRMIDFVSADPGSAAVEDVRVYEEEYEGLDDFMVR
jgi:acylphosphatase